jgi:hypothetical protein
MAVSAARLEANRRNARKSTGPRTEAGKNRSKMNPLKNGVRAKTLVLPGEDPRELEDRRAAWTASLMPCCELEQRAVDDAVIYSWRQDRARRAEAARADVRMADGEACDKEAIEKDVLDPGRRLFRDRLGPVAFYPLVADDLRTMCTRAASTSYPGRQADDADLPAALVLQLQSTPIGCEWLLGEWAKLKSILEKQQPWISSDKLKAARLLGRQPFDAIDDGDVALIFLASHRLKLQPENTEWAWEILMEMDENNRKRFRGHAADRELESFMPADAAEARDALRALIQRETLRLRAKFKAHRRCERVKAERAADLLAFDETPDGERLRRFEISSGRGYARAIETLLKLRKAPNGPLSEVRGPLPEGECSPPENVTNEATDGSLSVVGGECSLPQNVTNEATDGSLSVVRGMLSGEGSSPLENVTNEANGGEDDEAMPVADAGVGHETMAKDLDFDVDYELMRERFASTEAHRAERLRRINEESRELDQGSRATRRSRRCINPAPPVRPTPRRRRARAPSLAGG